MSLKLSFRITELFLKFILWWTPVRRLRTQDHFDRIGLFFVALIFVGAFGFINGWQYLSEGYLPGALIALGFPLVSAVFFAAVRSSIPTVFLEHGYIIFLLLTIAINMIFSHGLNSPYVHFMIFPAGYFFFLHNLRQGLIGLLYTGIFLCIGVIGSYYALDSGLVMNTPQLQELQSQFYLKHLLIILIFYFCFNIISAEGRKFRVSSGKLIADQREAIQSLNSDNIRLESRLNQVETELAGYQNNTQYLMNESTTGLRKSLDKAENELHRINLFDKRFYKQLLDQSAQIIHHSEFFLQNSSNPEFQRFIQEMKAKSEGLSDIVIQAAEFRKNTASQTSGSDFDFRQLIESCQSNLNTMNSQLFLNFYTQIDYRLPRFLFGNPEKISRILTSLLHHSYCITPKGFIQLQVLLKEQKNGAYQLHFRLRDSGLVLNREQSKRLFEPFATLDLYPAFVNRLNGLELPLAQKWLSEMGAELQYRYHSSLGNTFSFVLEFQESMLNQQFKDSDPIHPETTYFPDVKVAIINENKVSAGIIEKGLRKWDVNYETVHTAASAEVMLGKDDFSLILLDLSVQGGVLAMIENYTRKFPKVNVCLIPPREGEIENARLPEELPKEWSVLAPTLRDDDIFALLCEQKHK